MDNGAEPGGHRAYALVASGLVLTTLFALVLLFVLAPSGIPAQAVCWSDHPETIRLHLAGDLLTWSAWAAVPLLALYIMIVGGINGQTKLTFPGLIGWSAVSTWACGLIFLLDAMEIWFEVQTPRGILKIVTGVLSWVFVAAVLRNRRRLATIARAIYRAAQLEGEEGV